jgi:hypothetical protein
MRLGATPAPEIGRSDRFTVMRDVEGNAFCVLHDDIERPWVPPTST